jgi:hypothetical protein
MPRSFENISSGLPSTFGSGCVGPKTGFAAVPLFLDQTIRPASLPDSRSNVPSPSTSNVDGVMMLPRCTGVFAVARIGNPPRNARRGDVREPVFSNQPT